MKAEEIIKRLESFKDMIHIKHGFYDKYIDEEDCKIIDKAIIAVEKTIPTKVTHEATLIKCCTCPRCKNVVDEFTDMFGKKVRVTFAYCHFCGQALDWSDK